jgi:urate oxidase
VLTNASYGKSRVRLVQVARHGDRHDLSELTIGIRFEGEYDDAYVAGDNRDVLPTDTMKNTVYALAAGRPILSPETFALALGAHFLDRNPRLSRVRIDVTDYAWERIEGGHAGSAFVRRGPDARIAVVTADRHSIVVEGGVADLLVLKSSGSAFSGFMRDELTTLPDTDDRLLATAVTATWRYQDDHVEFNSAWAAARIALLDAFAGHESASVQHTLYAMGEAVLARVSGVASLHIVMPNKHHLPVDLSRFGLENRNEVFVPTDEPHGLIEATISR